MDWKKFDEVVDLKGIEKDIKESDSKSGDYEEVPYGTYEVKITKMGLIPTKKESKPMVSIWFQIIEGKYKGQYIFYNQVVTEGFQISLAKRFLNSLDCKEITFTSYAKFEEDIADIFEQAEDNLEFLLDYGQNKKGYATYKIEEVFEV